MGDLENISLSYCLEALSIYFEIIIWRKLKKDHASLFLNLIDRSRFNRRIKGLSNIITQVQEHISQKIENQIQTMVVHSIVVPVFKISREKLHKSFKESFEKAPAKGYSAVNRNWSIGDKLHIINFYSGVVPQTGIAKGNVFDMNYFKEINQLLQKKQLTTIEYISQCDLFDSFQLSLNYLLAVNNMSTKSILKTINQSD